MNEANQGSLLSIFLNVPEKKRITPSSSSNKLLEGSPEHPKRSFHSLFDSSPENMPRTPVQPKRVIQNQKETMLLPREFIVKTVKPSKVSPSISPSKANKGSIFTDQVSSTSTMSGNDLEHSLSIEKTSSIEQLLQKDSMQRDMRKSRMQLMIKKNNSRGPSAESEIGFEKKNSFDQSFYHPRKSSYQFHYQPSSQPIKLDQDLINTSLKLNDRFVGSNTPNNIRLRLQSKTANYIDDGSMSYMESPSGRSKHNSFRSKELVKHLIKFYAYDRVHEKKRIDPPGRLGATLTTIKDRIYLFGGTLPTFDPSQTLMVFNPHKETWKIPKCQGYVPTKTRIGHSAVTLKNHIYIFGGETDHCLNDLLVFYPHIKHWVRMEFDEANGTVISPRKYHAACSYDSLIVVYGGINDKGSYLNDFWVFDTSNLRQHNFILFFLHRQNRLEENPH